MPDHSAWFADEDGAPLFGYEGDWRESLPRGPTNIGSVIAQDIDRPR
jgi:hypothetical protein